MATVTKTIGAAGDYTTISGWEADLDNGAIYNSGDDAVGNIVDNANFDEDVVINGGGTVGLNSIRLTVDSTVRHDGTEGSGARIVRSTSVNASILQVNVSRPGGVIIEWLEIDSAQQGQQRCVLLTNGVAIVRYCILHGIKQEGATDSFIIDKTATQHCKILRNIVYDCQRVTNTRNHYGIADNSGSTRLTTIDNNTVDGIGNVNGGGTHNGIYFASPSSNKNAYNNVATRTANSNWSGTTGITADTNGSEDTTAPGTTTFQSLTPSNEFESLTAGSENYHLKSTSTIIDDGTDRGTTDGVNIDIDGRDVDAEVDTWDIGADEFVAAGGISIPVNDTATVTEFQAMNVKLMPKKFNKQSLQERWKRRRGILVPAWV